MLCLLVISTVFRSEVRLLVNMSIIEAYALKISLSPSMQSEYFALKIFLERINSTFIW